MSINTQTFPKFWQGRKVLKTGRTGFKGIRFILWVQAMKAELSGIALINVLSFQYMLADLVSAFNRVLLPAAPLTLPISIAFLVELIQRHDHCMDNH